jgi:hypothetical protein
MGVIIASLQVDSSENAVGALVRTEGMVALNCGKTLLNAMQTQRKFKLSRGKLCATIRSQNIRHSNVYLRRHPQLPQLRRHLKTGSIFEITGLHFSL